MLKSYTSSFVIKRETKANSLNRGRLFKSVVQMRKTKAEQCKEGGTLATLEKLSALFHTHHRKRDKRHSDILCQRSLQHYAETVQVSINR